MKYIESLREGERINEIYLCKAKMSALTKAGKPYDNVILQDKTGTLDAKIWDPGSIGIDEFDAFYHFELSESVEKYLKEVNGVQIFTTTHNTDIMSNDLLRPDCYFILRDNKIKAISDLTEKELRLAHNLQKMYKAGAFHGR